MFSRIVGAAVTTLIVVAAAGLGAWMLFSVSSGASLIIFRTGSMSPTLPQGSLAITVPTSASELKVGDVVTVRRVGSEMPVTHRVVQISVVPAGTPVQQETRAMVPGSSTPDVNSAAARQLILQGDDNDSPDGLPYTVTSVNKVLFGAPVAGTVLMFLQSPVGAGALLVTVGVLVTWAFWPRQNNAEEAGVPVPAFDSVRP